MFFDQREIPLIQFKPARAKKKVHVEELATHAGKNLFDEQKIDGERYLLHTCRPTRDNKYQHGITSRRVSEVTGRFVEKTDRVPHIANAPLPPKSMLDNEFVSSGDMLLIDLPGKFWDKLMEPNHPHMLWLKETYDGCLPVYPSVGNTVSIMGSLGPEAVRKQEERGLIWAYCFDIVQYLGQSALNSPQIARRQLLAKVMEPLNPAEGIILMPAWKDLTIDEVVEFFTLVTDPVPLDRGGNGIDGGEGLIRKSYDKPYDHAQNWWKLKADFPCDVVYTGESKIGEEGKTGKMFGLAASLEIGVYHQGYLVPIGWISAIRDGESNLQTPEDHRETWAGKAVECRHNGLQEDKTAPTGYTLKHPRFRRDRDDKNPKDCTFQALYDEVAKKAK